MRIFRMSVATSLGVLVSAAGIAAAAAAGAPLRPLSERDQVTAHGGECPLFFAARQRVYLYVVDHDYLIRTAAGRTICNISDAQFSALADGGSQTCGGYRITVRVTGPQVTIEASDSASSPATLTVAGRGRPWTIRGAWATQC